VGCDAQLSASVLPVFIEWGAQVLACFLQVVAANRNQQWCASFSHTVFFAFAQPKVGNIQ
jgi:hypothetical protein